MAKKLEYPECEKLSAVSEKSQELGCFLEWLDSNGIVLSKWNYDVTGTIEDEEGNEFPLESMLEECREFGGDYGKNKILALYFNIDLDKVEEEKREILKHLRSQNTV